VLISRYSLFAGLSFISITLITGAGGHKRSPDLVHRFKPASQIHMKDGPYTSTERIHSRFSSADFLPDGNLDKPVWQAAEKQSFDHGSDGQRYFPQSETTIATFWTATHVYFAFWNKYTTLNIYEGEDPAKERWELWNRDVAEVFINPRPQDVNHYYEFEVAPNNQWIDLEINLDKDPPHDPSWNSHFEHAVRVDAKNRVWTVEMRIPVAPMNVTSMTPGEWRINFYRADGPGDDQHRRFLSWSPVGKGTFHVPTRFGLIEFVR
jgi:alpha-galactosidase